MRLCVGSLKGGVGKTTTAVHLALGLARSGRTLLVDADPEQPQAFEWSGTAEDWPHGQCHVIQAGDRRLQDRVGPMVRDYEHLVIDTGPKNRLMLRLAMTLVDDLIVPVAPSTAELRELPRTFDLAAEVDTSHPLRAAVVLVQVRSGTRSLVEARALLGELDMPALAAEVRLREQYRLAFGTTPEDLGDYEQVLAELCDGVTA
jgi:chromosome partitioning protein